MSTLRKFELEAIHLMSGNALSQEQLASIDHYSGSVEYKYTGSGYFLTIEQEWLPDATHTLSEPAVVGKAGEIQCGFVLFLEPHKLVLECHTWGEVDVPENFRERSVLISTPPIQKIGKEWN